MKTLQTAASEAEKELAHIIGYENRVYKPWQLAGHMIEAVRLQTTVDELKLLWDQPAYIRPGFSVDENSVDVPVFLSKFSYIDQQFIEGFNQFQISEPGKGLLITELKEIYTPSAYNLVKENKDKISTAEGEIDEELFMQWQQSPVALLRPAYQKKVAQVINQLTKGEDDILPWVQDEVCEVAETILSISNRVWNMYHQFDYQYNPPKIVIVHKVPKPVLAEEIMRIKALSLLGFDIIVMAAKDYPLIEKGIKETGYDHFYGENNSVEIDPYESVRIKVEQENERSAKVFTRMGYITYGLIVAFAILLILLVYRILGAIIGM